MKTEAECFPCFFKQALYAARFAGNDPEKIKQVMGETAGILHTASLNRDPPYIATGIFHMVNKVMGVTDPFSRVKQTYNKIVADKIPALKELIDCSDDPFHTAVNLSLAGNIIDFGILDTFDLDAVIKDVLEHAPVIDHHERLKTAVEKADTMLFIADNAGEIGFDRLLIDEIRRLNRRVKIIVAVKKVPIINDATVYDAQFFGIEKTGTIIDNGSHHVGTFLPSCSPEMIRAYNHADVIIVKGQANWESLEEGASDKMFFLLKAKCGCVARKLGVREGDFIIKQG